MPREIAFCEIKVTPRSRKIANVDFQQTKKHFNWEVTAVS